MVVMWCRPGVVNKCGCTQCDLWHDDTALLLHAVAACSCGTLGFCVLFGTVLMPLSLVAVVAACLQGIPTLPELKLRYYELMITYYKHYHNYLEICRCYKAIYESDGVQADPALWQPVGGGAFVTASMRCMINSAVCFVHAFMPPIGYFTSLAVSHRRKPAFCCCSCCAIVHISKV